MTGFKKFLVGFFGIYVFIAMPLVYAQDRDTDGGSPKWRPGQRIQEIYSQLDLTDIQKKQLEANKQQHRAKMEVARQEMKVNREQLHAELMKAQLDMPKINAIHREIKSLEARMEDDRLNSVLAVRSILTPEQFLKFVNLMHKHKPDHE